MQRGGRRTRGKGGAASVGTAGGRAAGGRAGGEVCVHALEALLGVVRDVDGFLRHRQHRIKQASKDQQARTDQVAGGSVSLRGWDCQQKVRVSVWGGGSAVGVPMCARVCARGEALPAQLVSRAVGGRGSDCEPGRGRHAPGPRRQPLAAPAGPNPCSAARLVRCSRLSSAAPRARSCTNWPRAGHRPYLGLPPTQAYCACLCGCACAGSLPLRAAELRVRIL